MATIHRLVGTVLDETTAAVVRLPPNHRGQPWEFRRAGQSYSLASELRNDVDRITLASRVESLCANLDPRKKGTVERCPIPRAYFERGLTSDQRNPADHVALAHVAKLIVMSDGPVRQPDAVSLYTRVRHQFLCMVKEHHFPHLKVPAFDDNRSLMVVRGIINTELPVMAFPWCEASWSYALLPDLPSVETSEAVRSIGIYYRVLAAERQPRGDLKEQQLRDLEAIVADGHKPLLQYLVVTLTNSATWRALNISDGVARSVRTRFDALTLRETPLLRSQAEAQVMQKVIKSSGRGVKDLERAVNNRLRKLVNDRKLLRDPRQRLVREAVGAVLRAPDVLGVLRDVRDEWSILRGNCTSDGLPFVRAWPDCAQL